MHVVGDIALTLSFALALYGLGASVVGVRLRRWALVESGRTAAYSLLVLAAAASAAMLAALLTDDFSIRYVAQNSSRATPTFFKVLSLWSAHQGSLLLWNLVLAGYIASVAFRFRKNRPETLPWAMAVLYAIAAFYLILVLGPNRPFETLAAAPEDGRGPLPLLQNHWLMAIHPPFLYLGFVGFAVPYAFALAALLAGNVSDWWLRVTRRWTLAAWCFLTIGLLLGGLWSYAVLGWGGYWAWDPVENVALLPWLTATAFLHSSMVQERRGMLKLLNLSLIIGTFALTTFGTFITRGGLLASVHAFAQSLVGPLYLGFLALVLMAGFGLVALRAWRLRSGATFEAYLSRDAVMLANNWALLAIAFTVLLGTLFPLLVEALSNRQVTVGAPYFNQTTFPPFAALLLLMGIGPLLPWRRGSVERLLRRLAVPALAGALTALGLAAAGPRNLAADAGFGLAVFVGVANLAELARTVRAHARSSDSSVLAAIPAAVARNRRLSGGLIAHVGVTLAALAIIASSAFGAHTEVSLARGEEARFGGYALRYEGLRPQPEPHRMVLVADLSVSEDGAEAARLSPSLNLYPGASEPIGTPGIRIGPLSDLYASVLSFEERGERASFRFLVNPGVVWLWVGGLIVALGGLLALWPARLRPVPSEAPRALLEAVEAR